MKMKINELLKENRLKKGFTQKEVADQLYISNNTYSQYERGIRNIEIETFLKIADLLNLNIDKINFPVKINHLYQRIENFIERQLAFLSKFGDSCNVEYKHNHSEIQIEKDLCNRIFLPVKNIVLSAIQNCSQETITIEFDSKYVDGKLFVTIKYSGKEKGIDDTWVKELVSKGYLNKNEIKNSTKEELFNFCIKKTVLMIRETTPKMENYLLDFFEEYQGEIKGCFDKSGRPYYMISCK